MLSIIVCLLIDQLSTKDTIWQQANIGDIPTALSSMSFKESHYNLTGNNWYINPTYGDQSNDGTSPNQAWHTLQEVIEQGYFGTIIHANDTVWCMKGWHGDINWSDFNAGDYISIRAYPEQVPVIRDFFTSGVSHIILDGFWASAQSAPPNFSNPKGLITFQKHGSFKADYIQVLNCRVFSRWNSSEWTVQDWIDLNIGGLYIYDANHVVISNNLIWNVTDGINCNVGTDAYLYNNWVDNITQNGFQMGGNQMSIYHNLITDLYDYTPNHNDAIQFYYGGLTESNISIDSNVIFASTSQQRANDTLLHLAGITSYGEVINNCTIQNNWVLSDTEHGINMTGSNVKVINNSCWGYYYTKAFRGCPIRVSSTNGLVRNNITDKLYINAPGDHNLVIDTIQALSTWTDPSSYGFRLLSGGLAINTGSALLAPIQDFEGTIRPLGIGVDIGADEKE